MERLKIADLVVDAAGTTRGAGLRVENCFYKDIRVLFQSFPRLSEFRSTMSSSKAHLAPADRRRPPGRAAARISAAQRRGGRVALRSAAMIAAAAMALRS